MLAKPPENITIGEIVRVLEGETGLVHCIENPESCHRVDSCLTRNIWESATKAMYNELNGITLSDVIRKGRHLQCE